MTFDLASPQVLAVIVVGTLVVLVMLAVLILTRPGGGAMARVEEAARASRDTGERLERTLATQGTASRDVADAQGRALREELGRSMTTLGDSLQVRVGDLGRNTDARLDRLAEEAGQTAARLRGELLEQLARLLEEQRASAIQSADQQAQRLGEMAARLAELAERTEQRFEALRTAVDAQLDRLRTENAAKLEEMRRTVDEKLQQTLEQRLGESFRLVGEQLTSVHLGLGEMQRIAGEVGDLKRVLGNVKTRGGWAEVQLDAMLEQFLHPDQFERNAAIRPGTGERVEFAVRLPSKDDDHRFVLLPIDAKFPKEDYERLVDALERADLEAAQRCGRALEDRLRSEARRVRDKYIDPPVSTDFAIIYVPTEGLYAELARRPALLAELQSEFRIMVAGPSTLGALLNSLQMGFRTLAISRRSSEVWRVLGAAKSEFGKFGEVLEKVRRNIDNAGRSLDAVGTRTRAITRSLRGVEAPPGQALDPPAEDGEPETTPPPAAS